MVMGSLRLTALHDEWSAAKGRYDRALWPGRQADSIALEKMKRIDGEIRRRVATDDLTPYKADFGVPEFKANELLPGFPPFWKFPVLWFGVPDAFRDYSKRYGTITIPAFADWTNHAAHFLPVPGCHLCGGVE